MVVRFTAAFALVIACDSDPPAAVPDPPIERRVEGGTSIEDPFGFAVAPAEPAAARPGAVAGEKRPGGEVGEGPRAPLMLGFCGGSESEGSPTACAGRGRVEITPRHGSIAAAPLTLETIAIGRDAALDLGTGEATEIGSDLFLDRGVAEEQLLASEAHLEHAWVFDRAPAGAGDLTVRVLASGEAYAGWSERGHHFIDEATKIGLVYGEGTWIDALGETWPVPVTMDEGALVLTVPAAAVDLSSYPAMLDPTIFAETELATFGTGASAYDQTLPATSFDGTSYFVVWADYRDGLDQDIYAGRVSTGGALADAVSLPLIEATGNQTEPAIGFDGTNHLVVWRDHRGVDGDLYGAIVAPSAAIVVPEFPIAGGAGDQRLPAIAFDGTDFVVVFTNPSGGIESTLLQRVSSAGALVDPSPITIAPSAQNQRAPSIACGPANCLTCWHEGAMEDIQCRRTSGGTVVDAASLTITTLAGRDRLPSVAYDGNQDQYLVVWQHFDILGARVRASDGVILDPTAIGISTAANVQILPKATFDGQQFVVVFADARTDGVTNDLYAARVSSAGVVTDPMGIPVDVSANHQYYPAIVSGGGQSFAVWQDQRADRADIYGARISVAGGVLDANLAIARAMARQSAPSLQWDGTNFLIVFARSETAGAGAGGHNDIHAVRADRNNVILDGGGGRVIYAGAGNQSAPHVAWSGAQFLVVWADNRNGDWDVYGTRVSSAYAVLDPAGIPIATGPGDQTFPVSDYNGAAGRFLVMWQDDRSGVDFDIYGARVTTAGVVDAAPTVFSAAAGHQTRPDVSASTTGWMAVWTDARNGEVNGEDIYGRGLTSAGALQTEQLVAAAANRQDGARVVYNRGRNLFLSVWSDRRNGVGNADVMARTIDVMGVVQNPADRVLVSSALDETRPAVVVAANRYFLIWMQQAAAGSPEHDLFGLRYTFDFVPVEPAAFAISTLPYTEDQPALDARGGRNDVIAYQRYDDRAVARAERVFSRRVRFP
jgi:hypothetical protein